MTSTRRISIVGATGLLGAEFIQLLSESTLAGFELDLFASEDSVGEYYEVAGQEVEVHAFAPDKLQGSELVLLACPAEVSAEILKTKLAEQVPIIDLSLFTSNDTNVPACVPSVNRSVLDEGARLVRVPRAYSVALSVLLSAVRESTPVRHVACTSFHSVSHSGKKGLDELWEQTLGIFNQQATEQEAFAHQIAFNTVPLVDVVLENAWTREEQCIKEELKMLLEDPSLTVDLTAVRVPVFHGDGACVNLDFNKDVEIKEIANALMSHPKIVLHEHVEDCPMPVDVAGNDGIHVGRLRHSDAGKNRVVLWMVFDGIRTARVLTALEIAENILRSKTV